MKNQQAIEHDWIIDEQELTLTFIVLAKVQTEQIIPLLQQIQMLYEKCGKDLYVQITETEFRKENEVVLRKWQQDLCQHIFILDVLKTKELPIFTRRHLKENFTIHSIQDLTSQEVASIQDGENVWFPTRYHPLRYEQIAQNSLILRDDNELIGWCIVVPATQQMLMYDNIFVKERYQSLARSLSLFLHAISMQIERTQMQYLTFVVDGQNERMLKVMQNKVHVPLIDYQKVTVYKFIN
ncbi:hypothetical protein [Sporosarcina obsidiansis]|uniref:hypothetical protein n=1 Tax=Sporosarcina obsidiansis TaxID=2660748 RepID=UPI00129B329A|nr:hypothetical protein [Sporosarcina obsidiansis]